MVRSDYRDISNKYISRAQKLYNELFEANLSAKLDSISDDVINTLRDKSLGLEGALRQVSNTFFDTRVIPRDDESNEERKIRLDEKSLFLEYAMNNFYIDLHKKFRVDADEKEIAQAYIQFRTLENLVIRVGAINNDKIRKMHNDSTYDSLTGLCTVKSFMKSLRRFASASERARRNGKTDCGFAALFIDIDDFGKINNTYGHAAGDAVLKYVAMIMNDRSRDEDVCARLSGGADELYTLLAYDHIDAAQSFAERLRIKISEDVSMLVRREFPEFKLPVNVSIGISDHNGDGKTPDQLLKECDEAAYFVKIVGTDGENKKNGWHVYNPALAEVYQVLLSSKKMDLQAKLVNALRNYYTKHKTYDGFVLTPELVTQTKPN